MVKPNWEVSYERFTSGEHVETIALTTQPKAVQPATVFNHLLEALLHAKPLDYDRAASYLPASQRLTKSDCAMFADVQLSKRVDVVAERAPSTASVSRRRNSRRSPPRPSSTPSVSATPCGTPSSARGSP